MRHTRRLRATTRGPWGPVGQRLRELTGWAVASSLSVAVGCEQQTVDKQAQPLQDGAWQKVPCNELLLATNPIRPEQPLDYIGMYTTFAGAKLALLTSDYGNPCQGASDRTACLSALTEQLKAPGACDQNLVICPSFVVTTAGDQVARMDDAAALARVLGTIDTASEAVLVAQMQGLRAVCGSQSTFDVNEAGTQVQAIAAGYRVHSKWDECGGSVGDQTVEVRRDGTTGALEPNNVKRSSCAIGRRPAGLLVAQTVLELEPLAERLAECAQLEAASVPAFLRLERELLRLGALPLAAEARRSAADEVRHAQQMRFLAERYGARVETPRLAAPARTRSALEIGLENSVEGCVRETFGALIAWQQAALASDPLLAEVMHAIAVDETRHAELAWAVAGWLEPQLSARERAAVDAARSQALAQLDAEIAIDPLPDSARARLGWPSAARQHALLLRMASELALS